MLCRIKQKPRHSHAGLFVYLVLIAVTRSKVASGDRIQIRHNYVSDEKTLLKNEYQKLLLVHTNHAVAIPTDRYFDANAPTVLPIQYAFHA